MAMEALGLQSFRQLSMVGVIMDHFRVVPKMLQNLSKRLSLTSDLTLS